jgi:TatD DNase family protein
VPDLIAAAAAAGVERMVTIGCGRAQSEQAVQLADQHPEVYAAVGVHPVDAGRGGWSDSALDWIRHLAAHDKVVAIGETGLDYFHDRDTPRDQPRAFRAQAELAADLGMPLVIHTRDAADDTMAILREVGLRDVVLHCFSIPEYLDEALERGWTISLAGPVTFPRNTELRDVVPRIPADRLLVETDAPYLAPVPMRGKRNQPAFVAHTLACVADLRGDDVADLDRATTATAARVFGW